VWIKLVKDAHCRVVNENGEFCNCVLIKQYLFLAHATSYWNVSSFMIHRASPEVEKLLSPEQAGCRRNCSTCEQVVALTTHIENGFQQQLKTGAVFLDLTAAYNTVWHTGLLYKLSKNIPHWFARLIELFLHDQRFRVHMGDDTSTWRSQVNGLLQGSVLSPTLFNLYTNDLPVTGFRKFIYADDMCLTKQAQRYAVSHQTWCEKNYGLILPPSAA